jgi:hypothetical protein
MRRIVVLLSSFLLSFGSLAAMADPPPRMTPQPAPTRPFPSTLPFLIVHRNYATREVLEHQDAIFQASDATEVRYQDPPIRQDARGQITLYTVAELRELRGNDPKLPGYKADFTDLKPGQIVRMVTGRKKDPARPNQAEAVTGDWLGTISRVEKDGKKVVLRFENRAQAPLPTGVSGKVSSGDISMDDPVTMIVILQDATVAVHP